VSAKKSKGLFCRVKGDWHAHEKVIALSLEARGLWVTLASWCAGNRTDGRFNEKHARELAQGRHKAPLHELIEAGLVDLMSDGTFQMHDWAEHNITRAEHEELKAADVARKARNRGVAEGTTFRAEAERNGSGTGAESGGVPLEAPSPSPDPASREGLSSERGERFSEPEPWWDGETYSTDGGLQ
jgi:hypothetical protein